MSKRPPAQSLEHALSEARDHARTSAAEAVAALESLLDATAFATTGRPADPAGALGTVVDGLDELRRFLLPQGGAGGGVLLDAVASALDHEIARWEERSREDPEARPVLRAFLGLRELLWELGVRSAAETEAAPETSSPPPAEDEHEEPVGRVQRIRVEG